MSGNLLSHSNSFGFEMEKDAAGCRALNRNFIVGEVILMKSRLEQLLDELLRQIDIPAMEQAVSEQYKSQIRRRWELPADYWRLLERCCGLRTVWSNDTYEALEL